MSRGARTRRLASTPPAITVPTMLVRGKASDVVSPEGAEHLQQLIPHALVREARAGHMVAGDDNDVFVTQVVDFLDEQI
jgi:pimeloyl-ACP methyl ester carboxylesterase